MKYLMTFFLFRVKSCPMLSSSTHIHAPRCSFTASGVTMGRETPRKNCVSLHDLKNTRKASRNRREFESPLEGGHTIGCRKRFRMSSRHPIHLGKTSCHCRDVTFRVVATCFLRQVYGSSEVHGLDTLCRRTDAATNFRENYPGSDSQNFTAECASSTH